MERLRFDAGLTLPDHQRYTDQQFRRLSRWFFAGDIDVVDACALHVALELLGSRRAANRAFHWTSPAIWRQIAKVEKPDGFQDALDETLREWTPKHSIALMRAMRDGGWERGKIPPIIRQAWGALRKNGMSVGKIAKLYDVGVAVVAPRDRSAAKRRSAAAAGALAV